MAFGITSLTRLIMVQFVLNVRLLVIYVVFIHNQTAPVADDAQTGEIYFYPPVAAYWLLEFTTKQFSTKPNKIPNY